MDRFIFFQIHITLYYISDFTKFVDLPAMTKMEVYRRYPTHTKKKLRRGLDQKVSEGLS